MAQSRFRRIITAPLKGLQAVASVMRHPTAAWGWLLPNTSFDYSRSVGTGLNSSVVMAPLGWLQRNVTQAPIRISKRAADSTTWTPIDPGASGAGRLLDLLDMPNPYYHGGVLRKASILSWKLDGNAYWRVIKNGMGAPIELWWIPHTLIEPKRTEGSAEFITHYEYTPNGLPVRLEVDDVIHFRDGIDPDNTMKGMSGFKSLIREVFTDDEAANYTATLLKNSGVPGIILSPKPDAQGMLGNTGDPSEIKAKLEQATSGDNRGRGMVMTAPTDVQQFGFNPQQMNVRDLRKVPEERVSGVLGVAAVVCGLGAGLDRATFANMAEAREASTEEGLIPYWGEEALVIKHRLLPMVEGANSKKMRVDADLSEVRVLSEDQDKIIDRAVKLAGAGLAEVAEAREAAGLPVDDTHRIFLRSFSMVEVPAGSTMADVQAAEVATQAANAAPKTKQLNAASIQKLQAGIHRARTAHEKQLAQHLEPVFADLGKHVAAAWNGEVAKSLKTPSDADPDVLAIVAATVKKSDLTAWRKRKLDPVFQQHYRAVYEQTGKTISSTIGLNIDDAASDLELAAVRRAGEAVQLVQIEEQTKNAIFGALEEGRAAGLNPVDIERTIRDYVEAGGPKASVSARAMRIARTETRSAQNLGAIDTYKATGVYDRILVLDNRIGFDDPDCMDIDGSVVSLDEAESLDADEHPNGTRDTTTPAIED